MNDRITLTAVAGAPAVLIEDAVGEAHTYLFDVVQRVLSWSVRLTKLGADGAEVLEDYMVITDGSAWHCPCADYRFRFRPHRTREAGADCKHIEVAKGLRRLLTALQSTTSTEQDHAHGCAR